MTEQDEARYIVGIDLGTTNSAVAFIDTTHAHPRVENFPILQLTAPGETQACEVLPSFLYLCARDEFRKDLLQLPCRQSHTSDIVGVFARDHGAEVPGRLVGSAKSWLSHAGVDRTAPLLPWHASEDVTRVSPVQATTAYLTHMRAAWNHAHPDDPLEAQDVVITVPASFDEVARELTVRAAAQAGLACIILLEEPQAAFYAWINRQGQQWQQQVEPGQTILVCDIGGGTSDFTLIEVRCAQENVSFHRIAVGDHLILGGDNLDLALAYHVEAKLDAQLSPGQFSTLVRSCQKAKEILLGANAPGSVTVNILGAGSALIGGALQVEIGRHEVHDALIEGFFPHTDLTEKPVSRRSGFQEFGLPYASDHAMTRYLADFLIRHATGREGADPRQIYQAGRPDIVLFNGGLFLSPQVQTRLVDILSAWFSSNDSSWQPKVLEGDRPELAVARGAAYYGYVRRGHGTRINAGLARSYYIGVQPDQSKGNQAICLAPAGLEEGQTIDLSEREFTLLIRQPVEFSLYASSVRTTDPSGDLIEVDPSELTALPPVRTVLRSGKKQTADRISATLHARLSAIGTLDLWCSERQGDRRWRLEFDVRSVTCTELAAHTGEGETEGFVDTAAVDQCQTMIIETFDRQASTRSDPQGLVKRLEKATDMTRSEWPPSLLRQFWEALYSVQEGRKIGAPHEVRWLNLIGFALRPGYGYAVDDWRVKQTWQLFREKVTFSRNQACRSEWWILWRRIAGGLLPGQQQALCSPLFTSVKEISNGRGAKKTQSKAVSTRARVEANELAEMWRLLGTCERLSCDMKIELGDLILRIGPKPESVKDAALWALGRIGARSPLYGPLNKLIPASQIEQWISPLIGAPVQANTAFALMQLCRRTNDRYRDISMAKRREVCDFLNRIEAPSHFIELVEKGGHLKREEQILVFGERLPCGLRLLD